MAKYLALEWGLHEARVVQAHTRLSDIVVEDAFTIDLTAQEERGAAARGSAKLCEALAARRVGRAETLVAVGRASIDLRMLSLPPAPEEELPDLVRFQALRQFTTIGEDWPLDFITVETREDGGHNVLAAAISPELVRQIDETCKACGLIPSRLVLRPFAAASLLRRRAAGASSGCWLSVDLLTDEADLTVLAEGRVVFTRTVRLTSHGDPAPALLGEIRRTIAAAHNQLLGKRVEHVGIFGDGEEHAALKSLIEQQLSLRVELIDPFTGLELGRALRSARPAHPGRFAPLLGMLLDEASRSGQMIDFLHPRKRPEPPNTRRRNILLTATLAAMLLAAAVLLGGQFRRLDRQITDLTAASKAMDAAVEKATKRQQDVQEIDAFRAGDVTWLDELHWFSQKFPPAEEAIVTQLYMQARPAGGGQMNVQGYANQPSTIAEIERRLRDQQHVVKGDRGTLDQQRENYRWQFNEWITVEPTESASP